MTSIQGISGTSSHSYSDVFISFCPENLYFDFVDDLYEALKEKSIETFRGDAEQEKIEESWISIVVLSENYASHTQCLDQLVRIMECKKKMNQIVYPIYYQVDRSNLNGVYGAAMEEHNKKITTSGPEILQKWSSALAQVAQIPGFDLRHWFDEKRGELIQRIVELVYKSFSRYDVFISFEGQDTGYTFTGNLYNALRRKKIKTFFVDDKLWQQQDVKISSSFLKAIGESRISIVVLSQSYAQSAWCLEELTSIMEGKNANNQLVLPVFYKVTPSHVRKQEEHFKVTMDEQEKRLGENRDEQVQKWKKYLSEVANLTGVPLFAGYEYEHIQKIVESTLQSLSKYDVFLSYSREDTGHSFARYLYTVLCRSGFKTFMDDVEIGNEDQISHTLTKVIENSKHSIIIFSKNYGYSSWCLDEIVKILECSKNKKKNHMIWPVYYNVHPGDVRFQINSYGGAMSAHLKRYGADKVKNWKATLSEVTYRGGYAKVPKTDDIFVQTEQDTELIKKIVEHLSLPDSELLPVQEQPHSFMSTSGFISWSQLVIGN